VQQSRDGAVPAEFYIGRVHQRLMIDLHCPQAVPAVDEVDLFCNTGQGQGVRCGGVAAAYHRHGLAPIGRAVAGGAVVNALSNKRFLAGNAQGTGRRAGGDDHRAPLKDALAGLQRLDLPGKAGLVHLRQLRHRAEALGTLLHFFAQCKAVDAALEAGVVVDLLRQRHLPAGGELFQHQRGKPGTGGVQGSGISGGAAADDDHVIDLLHSHALTAPAFPG
jgi:hypothetical protein